MQKLTLASTLSFSVFLYSSLKSVAWVNLNIVQMQRFSISSVYGDRIQYLSIGIAHLLPNPEEQFFCFQKFWYHNINHTVRRRFEGNISSLHNLRDHDFCPELSQLYLNTQSFLSASIMAVYMSPPSSKRVNSEILTLFNFVSSSYSPNTQCFTHWRCSADTC